MGFALRDSRRHTYADYLGWGEEQHYELIDGLAWRMAPTPELVHQEVAGEIYRQLANALQGKPCRALIAPVDVRLPRASEADEEVDTVVQPDVLVVCDAAKLDRRGVRGAPDLVIEVVSPASASHDHVVKRAVYERAGVREYWLVHPWDRLVTRYLLAGAEYGKPEVQELAGETPVAVLPGVAIRWDALGGRLPAAER
jgi:Uma2 family endonuclease